jgi:Autotransporter beta-domain
MKKDTNRLRLLLLAVIVGFVLPVQAQDSSRLYFTTAAGIIIPVSSFGNAYRNSLGLNSGIEYRLGKHYFAQFAIDFNAIRYNQQVKDAGSPYLFQNTSSSVFLAGIHIGRNIPLSKSGRLFTSPYLGMGYANIGEPRLTVNNTTGIIKQEVARSKGLFGRQGLRLGFTTKSRILQTLYVDASWWAANVRVQGSRPRAASLLVGTRFGF